MKTTISNQAHWRQILHRQSLANAERWLALIEDSDDPSSLVIDDYDNLLRALETTLQSPQSFRLAYRLVQALYSDVFGYADWDRWLVYLEKALAISQQLGYGVEEAQLLEQIGNILYFRGDLARAETLYKQGVKKYQELSDLANYARILSMLAVLHDLRGRRTDGIALCQEALKIAQSIEDERAIAHANLNLSHLHVRARRWEPALTTAQTAHSAYRELGESQFATKALLNMVASWAHLGQWREVNDVSEELVRALEASGDIHNLSMLKTGLGIAAYEQQNYEMAEAAWQEALRLHSQMQEPKELADLYNNLGMVYTKTAEWAAAQEMLEKAVSAYATVGDVYYWGNALDNLADLYEAQEHTAACRQVLQKAIAGLETADENPQCQALLATMRQRLESLPTD